MILKMEVKAHSISVMKSQTTEKKMKFLLVLKSKIHQEEDPTFNLVD